WAKRMASASVSAFGDRVTLLGSAGRFRANGPLAAHQHFRCTGYPLELSLPRRQASIKTARARKFPQDHPGNAMSERTPAILPRSGPNVYPEARVGRGPRRKPGFSGEPGWISPAAGTGSPARAPGKTWGAIRFRANRC